MRITLSARNSSIAVILLVLGMLLSVIPLSALRFSGKVLDQQGKPIESALLISGRMQTLSARDGSFIIEVTDSLQISRLGYFTLMLPVAKLTPRIVLQPDPVVMPTYRVYARISDASLAAADVVHIPFDPEQPYSSTTEMLGQSAALQAVGTSLKGEVAELGILGNLSRHTLVLVDGIPINPLGEPFDFARLDPHSIKSIEVIKNNASAYGGAAAIGGIVRITTKQLESSSYFESQTELGSYDYQMQNFTLGGSQPRGSYRIGVNGYRTGNDFPLSPAEQEMAGGDSTRVNNRKAQFLLTAAFHTRFKPVQISLAGDVSSFRRQLPGPLNFLELYRKAFLKGTSWHPQLRITSGTGAFREHSTLWLSGDDTVYDNTEAPLSAVHSKYRQRLQNYGLRQGFSYQDSYLLANLAGEAAIQQYKYMDMLYPSHADIDTLLWHYSGSASVQAAIHPLSFLLLKSSLAGRYDRYDAEEHYTGRAELSLRNTGSSYLEIGGTYGNSFAVPSFYDLYWKGDSQAIGNPNLHSESSQGFQGWAVASLPWIGTKVALHRNIISNMIQWQQVQMNGTVWKPVNLGSAELRNLELEAWINVHKWLQVNASLLHTDARDTSILPFSQAPYLMYRPDTCHTITASLMPGSLRLWGKYSHIGRQYITRDNLIDPLPEYALMDAGISYLIRYQAWEITPYFSVKNIQDLDYQVHSYVPEPGRSYFGGIRLRQNN